MSVQQAIHEHWESYRPLTRLVPASRVFTGTVPERDESGQSIDPPYVELTTQGDASNERTSSGATFTTAVLRFMVVADYATAKQVVQEIHDHFNRADFRWSRGEVLDMKRTNADELSTESDGVWEISIDFLTRIREDG